MSTVEELKEVAAMAAARDAWDDARAAMAAARAAWADARDAWDDARADARAAWDARAAASMAKDVQTTKES